MIENEITYLAFTVPAALMVIFGGGYAVPVLEPLNWLAGLDIVYWGDIDPHGFAILNRLRRYLSHARSMLMDRVTLLDHREHWGREPSPTAVVLDRLDPAESTASPISSRRMRTASKISPSVRSPRCRWERITSIAGWISASR